MSFSIDENFINTINNTNVAVKNLYKLTFLDSSSSNTLNGLSDKFQFFAKSIKFNGEELDLERNEISKWFTPSKNGYKRTDTITINWLEDDNLSIYKFHNAWISQFYDRKNDQFISQDLKKDNNNKTVINNAIYKNLILTLPKSNLSYVNNCNSIEFFYIIPKNFGSLDLKWSKSPESMEHNIDYYIKTWNWVEIKKINDSV